MKIRLQIKKKKKENNPKKDTGSPPHIPTSSEKQISLTVDTNPTTYNTL